MEKQELEGSFSLKVDHPLNKGLVLLLLLLLLILLVLLFMFISITELSGCTLRYHRRETKTRVWIPV